MSRIDRFFTSSNRKWCLWKYQRHPSNRERDVLLFVYNSRVALKRMSGQRSWVSCRLTRLLARYTR